MQTGKLAFYLSIISILAFALAWGVIAQEPPPPASSPTPQPYLDQTLLDQLGQVTQGRVQVSYHAQTGKVRFIGTDAQHPISQAGAQPEQAARAFLGAYGQLLGLNDEAEELRVMRSTAADAGRSFLRFQQVYQGTPVLGGELIVQMDAAKNVVSVNGEILPAPKVNTVAGIGVDEARRKALEMAVKQYGLTPGALTTTEPELWIYDPALLGAPGPRMTALVWRVEVKAGELDPVKELVLVDAHSGIVHLHFNQIETAKYRRIYDNLNDSSYGLPGRGPVRVEGQGAMGITDVDKAYDFAGDVYDFYARFHGRDSLDGAGMQLISTVRYCEQGQTCPFANAFWNGSQMVYGQGYSSADDVVGHEMTHGVTNHESRLFYYRQSGAINEALSDIWGEFIDRTNGKGNDSAGVKWLVGEDMSGGAIRSMSNPPAYGDPDRMGSYNYVCSSSDNGGVHTNSGVANKAAYLMTDGGSFNGYTISGIGITKTAMIFYEVQTNLLTSASDYADLYNGLQQACTDMIDSAVSAVGQTVTVDDSIRYTASYTLYVPMIMKKYRQTGITAADCQQVRNALDAVEMAAQPSGCSATHAPVCPTGHIVSNIFFDDLENPNSGRWTRVATVGSNAWSYPQNPNPLSRYGIDATYATSGQYNFFGYDQPATADYDIRMTSSVALPGGTTPYLHFNHAYDFEGAYDGGVVEYSTNGGSTWTDADSLFTDNGYDGAIFNYSGSTNPLRWRRAFVWGSYGYTSSRLNLGALAGQNVRFRFRIGADRTGDNWGWFIDDVRIYTCVLPPAPAAPVLSSISNSDNDGNYNVTWGAVSGATSFTLQEDDNAGFPNPTARYTGPGVSWSASNQPNGMYYYRVLASNAGGNSGWSNVQPTTVSVLPPAAPALNSINNPDGDGNYAVTWNAVSGASSYTLQEDDDLGFSSPTTRFTGSATSWSASNHVTGTYYYRAQASNSGGASGWSNTQSVTITVAPVGWTTIINENFEGSFPGTAWKVYDSDGATNGEYYWAKRTCRPYAGGYSGWVVGGGASGALLGCSANYPNYADSMMTYGPFDLTDATAADLSFKLWMNAESTFDIVCRAASINGVDYYGTCTSGNTSGWVDRVLDLSAVYMLGDLRGQPDVWIMLEFYSDSLNVLTEGAYVDNITLRKCTLPMCMGMSDTESLTGDGRVVEFPRTVTLLR